MVLVRASFVMAAVSGEMTRRNELARVGMQLVTRGNVWWAQKAAWFRNVPYTAIYPTVGQMEARVHFARLAREAKSAGETGTRTKHVMSDRLKREFIGAAAYIADKMAGFKAPHAMRPEEYPSRMRRSVHTAEELEQMLSKALATATA
ncbi:MAG: hypothetical protein ACP5MH_07255 [Thermoproteus sp.]